MKTTLNISHYLYLGLCLFIILLATLHEIECIPTGYLEVSPEVEYVIQLFCIGVTLGGSWFALRLFSIKSVKEALTSGSSALARWNIIRILTIGTPILINLESYYALFNNESILYCFLITLIALVFCWPKPDTDNA